MGLAYKHLQREDFSEWREQYARASTSLENRSALAQLAAQLETDLILLGGAVIEDRLQEGVPETVRSLRQAGI